MRHFLLSRSILCAFIILFLVPAGALCDEKQECASPLWQKIQVYVKKGTSRDAVKDYLNTLDGIYFYIAQKYPLIVINVDRSGKLERADEPSRADSSSPVFQPPGVDKYIPNIQAGGNEETPDGEYVIHTPLKSSFSLIVEEIATVSFDESDHVADLTCFVSLTGP